MKLVSRIAGTSALLLLAAAASTARAAPAAADAPRGPVPALFDGCRRVDAERLGPPRIDAAGRALAPVRLRYAGRGLPVDALVGRGAIVALEPGAEAELAGAGVRAVRPLMPSIGLWLVEDEGGGDGIDVAERLGGGRARGVREAFPDLYVRVAPAAEQYTPNDPRLPGQWYFESLRMTEAWGLTQGDPGTSIVVVDTGCDLGHPDLVAKLDPGLDVVDGDDDPTYQAGMPGAAHGTECAGLVAAGTDNGEGIAGGCPACRLRCVRMLSEVATPYSAIADAYNFALEVNAAVVSNSWGFVDAVPVPQVIADAINNLFDTGRGGLGTLVIFASGNDDRELGDEELQAVRGVLTVGAINHFDEQTSFTNYGSSVDLVAPTGTLTTDIRGAGGDDPSDYTDLFGGTSSACPVAAGIAALLVSAAPDRTAAEIYEVMTRTARAAPYASPDGDGHDPIYGYGIIDPVPALNDLLGITQPPPPPPPEEPADAEDDAGCACSAGPAAPGGLGAALYAAGLLLRRAHRRRR